MGNYFEEVISVVIGVALGFAVVFFFVDMLGEQPNNEVNYDECIQQH